MTFLFRPYVDFLVCDFVIFVKMGDTCSAEEIFKDWLETSELDETTARLLVENGFKSVKSCKKLNQTLITKHFGKSLSLGQLLLLEDAVDELKTSQSATSTKRTMPTENTEPEASTSALQNAGNEPQTQQPGQVQDQGAVGEVLDFTRLSTKI